MGVAVALATNQGTLASLAARFIQLIRRGLNKLVNFLFKLLGIFIAASVLNNNSVHINTRQNSSKRRTGAGVYDSVERLHTPD